MAKNKKANEIKWETAFQYFYSLGENRTQKAVADKFGVTEAAISQWADKFKWKERIINLENEKNKKFIESVDKQIFDDKLQYRKIIQAALSRYVEQLKNGYIGEIKHKDAIELMKLDTLIMDKLDHGTAYKYKNTNIDINKPDKNNSDDSEETTDTLNNLYEVLKNKADDKK